MIDHPAIVKPYLRGWSHAAAALAAIVGLVVLIFTTRDDPAKLVSMIIYGTGLVLLFAVSAIFVCFGSTEASTPVGNGYSMGCE